MDIQLHYRAQSEESIEDRHLEIISALAKIPKPWGLEGSTLPLLPDISDQLSVQVGFGPDPSGNIGGYILYTFRGDTYLEDHAQFDDSMSVRFDPERVDFAYVVQKVFPAYVQAFKAYRATIIIDKDLIIDEWPVICETSQKTGLNIDGRDSVYRITSVNYFDRKLCHRAFGLQPETIVERLEGMVERVQMLDDGALLIVSSELLERQEIESIDEKIRGQLGVLVT